MGPPRRRLQWEDEDASTLGHGSSDDEYDEQPALDRAPVHPIACMQAAFEESIMESLEPVSESEEKRKHQQDKGGGGGGSAKARRQRMLDEDEYNGSYTAQWRMKPSAKYHPLWKLVAQISFGVHLLNQQLAKSDEEVSNILKMHVQEVDVFLENTTEDFDLALADIQERINYLKLPLEHVNIFDIMLDDRQFRTSIVEGNEKIEKIVERTARAMNDALLDVEKGMEATEELSRYLQRIGGEWTDGDDELCGIYDAMCGNSEGWLECLQTLQTKGNDLGIALVQLGSILNEMTKRAGVASRRSIIAHRAPEADQRPGSGSASRSASRSGSRARVNSPPSSSRLSPGQQRPDRPTSRARQDKPLPRDPDPTVPGMANLHRSPSRPPQKAHMVPMEQRFENTRRPPPPPPRQPSSVTDAPEIPARDMRRLQTPEARYDGPRSGTSTPISKSPNLTVSHSPAMYKASSPTAPAKSPSILRKRLTVRGTRDKDSSPMVDSAYSSGSSGSSNSFERERKPLRSPALTVRSPMLSPPSPMLSPSSLPPQMEQTHPSCRSSFLAATSPMQSPMQSPNSLSPAPKLGLFPQMRETPPMTPQALSIRSGITGGGLTLSTTLESRPSTAMTVATTAPKRTNILSNGSGRATPDVAKKRGSLIGFRKLFRKKTSAKLGPTAENEAE
ncbi:uncharacterized protein K452DRAFT_296010 [Aplosporella prunicola CBS 121167]|uniref:Uncharacterized protein n=1 Tax=Aplosporella prunicola CBS 121167 TaxID=1176127 RepID=A0A6A6BPT7_9PEZI|nr:uncharacterized protein K452DRAFT_296010 [Aplosporella prunicola CBS 121167]KAF2144581.1 hypothetical protein K452DRAFT_296010 [Aplosporella prunicola CBS 121167]